MMGTYKKNEIVCNYIIYCGERRGHKHSLAKSLIINGINMSTLRLVMI